MREGTGHWTPAFRLTTPLHWAHRTTMACERPIIRGGEGARGFGCVKILLFGAREGNGKCGASSNLVPSPREGTPQPSRVVNSPPAPPFPHSRQVRARGAAVWIFDPSEGGGRGPPGVRGDWPSQVKATFNLIPRLPPFPFLLPSPPPCLTPAGLGDGPLTERLSFRLIHLVEHVCTHFHRPSLQPHSPTSPPSPPPQLRRTPQQSPGATGTPLHSGRPTLTPIDGQGSHLFSREEVGVAGTGSFRWHCARWILRFTLAMHDHMIPNIAEDPRLQNNL